MTLQERFLGYFLRNPSQKDYNFQQIELIPDNPLKLLEAEYTNFKDIIVGKKIVDFGCGKGHQSIALAEKYSCQVIGTDINETVLEKATSRAQLNQIPEAKLSFTTNISDALKNNIDIVISHNSFEHFDDPLAILNEMKSLLNDNGKIIITFGPPWLAPYGSHMHFFCKIPWVHVFFSEQAVMNARKNFRDDNKMTYVDAGMNKMTISKFEQLIESIDLKIVFKRYKCIKGLDPLSKIPYLREFFINHVSVLLAKSN